VRTGYPFTMSWLTLLVYLSSNTASAFTGAMHGPYVEFKPEVSLVTPQIRPRVGATGVAGWWFGEYDEVYAFGRFTGVGLSVSPHVLPGKPMTLAELEVRRGWDLFVVQLVGALRGGIELPTLDTESTHWSARAAGQVKWRIRPKFGLILGASGGVIGANDSGALAPVIDVELGIGWSQPVRRKAQ